MPFSNYLNTDATTFLDRLSNNDARKWAWMVIEEIRSRFPQSDHWTTGANGGDIRFGVKKRINAKKGDQTFMLKRRGGGIPYCIFRNDANQIIVYQEKFEQKQLQSWFDVKCEGIAMAGSGNNPRAYDANHNEENQDMMEPNEENHNIIGNPVSPLNQILFGPPGTGKTYHTINKALAILDPDCLTEHEGKGEEGRGALKARFDELVLAGQVAFVTFHQSFSYEDFVEGIRAETRADGALEYCVVDGVFAKLCKRASSGVTSTEDPFVLIIDEINRGNVSRIFGELITLIEPSKRAGAAEALSTVLPYSKQPLTVPDNLYLIGTMNTADRSLAGLDIALRRRFVFEEMAPRPELLKGVVVAAEGVSVDVEQLLEIMNQRIELLLDRDHCLGHAYFMPLKEDASLAQLEAIFKNQILPLLQEYFFEDWQHIAWVLNDHRKGQNDQFLQAPQSDVSALFGDKVAVGNHRQRWTINEGAFKHAGAYAGIIEVSKESQ